MANTGKLDQFGMRDALSQIDRMFALDKLIMFAMDNGDGHTDLGQSVGRIIGLCALHKPDRRRKFLELVGCGR